MPRTTITITAEVEDLELAAAALTEAAAQRRRAAERAAAMVERERRTNKGDMRTAALKVLAVLAAAGILEDVADQLVPAAAPDVDTPPEASAAEPGSIDAVLAAADAADSPATVTSDGDVVPMDARARATLESLQQAAPAPVAGRRRSGRRSAPSQPPVAAAAPETEPAGAGGSS